MNPRLALNDLITLACLLALAVIWWPTDGLPSPFVPSGPRTVTILEETDERTPEYAAMFTALPGHQMAKEHRIVVLDDDLDTPLVNRLETLTSERPAVFIEAGDKVLYSGKCPLGVEALNALVREH